MRKVFDRSIDFNVALLPALHMNLSKMRTQYHMEGNDNLKEHVTGLIFKVEHLLPKVSSLFSYKVWADMFLHIQRCRVCFIWDGRDVFRWGDQSDRFVIIVDGCKYRPYEPWTKERDVCLLELEALIRQSMPFNANFVGVIKDEEEKSALLNG